MYDDRRQFIFTLFVSFYSENCLFTYLFFYFIIITFFFLQKKRFSFKRHLELPGIVWVEQYFTSGL